MNNGGSVGERIVRSIREVLPKTLKVVLWLVKLTVGVSFGMLLLKYFGILPVISGFLSPVFNGLGLPGEAALAYVTGFFVNVYSAIAIAATLMLDSREMTILAVMVLCSHNMITETAVQKKTGSPVWKIVTVRVLTAFLLGYFLNLVLPGTGNIAERLFSEESGSFMEMFSAWIPSTVFLVIKMTVLIFMLNILQRLLAEFGIIRRLAKFLAPLLLFFGLPKKTAFLWIVANILGLAYGAAVMIDESERGAIGKRDADLLNLHISVSHSNLEDMFLFCSVGGIWYALLFPRLFMAFLWVWIQRALYYVSERFSKCNG